MGKKDPMYEPIKEVVLDLGDKDVRLSYRQAERLKDALDGLFGKEIVREVRYHSYPWYYPVYETTPRWDQYQITCGDATISGSTMTLKATNG